LIQQQKENEKVNTSGSKDNEKANESQSPNSTAFNLTNELSKIKVPITHTDTINLQDDSPQVLVGPYIDEKNNSILPFYISLTVQDHLLHKCMLDYGASHNLLPQIIMD
jgi:hypothetical protein